MRTALIAAGIFVVLAAVLISIPSVDAVDTARHNLVATWVSTEDAKFTREFKEDGNVIDAYEDSAPDTSGRWTLFTKAMPVEGFTGELEEEALYLAIGVPESDALYFKITHIDENSLELAYLDGGGMLSFARAD